MSNRSSDRSPRFPLSCAALQLAEKAKGKSVIARDFFGRVISGGKKERGKKSKSKSKKGNKSREEEGMGKEEEEEEEEMMGGVTEADAADTGVGPDSFFRFVYIQGFTNAVRRTVAVKDWA